MNRGNLLNALLVEIMIAVLFFALSATVILQCFMATRALNNRTALADEALYSVQELAELLYASESWDTLLSDSGLVENNGMWTADREGWQLEVLVREEPHASGILRTASISAQAEDESLVELLSTRYIPQEVLQ